MKKRLETLLSYVMPCGTFADIGCDHGLVAVSVLKSKICNKVIAADVSVASLRKAIKLADIEHIGGLIAVVSDGFDNIKEPVDEAMIAGMGGEEICKILSRCENFPNRLILQPMKNAEKLRRELVLDFGYPITDDFIFFDGEKYYDLIVADKSAEKTEYSEDDFVFGKGNLNGNGDFKRFAASLYKTYVQAINSAKDEATKADLERKIKSLERFL